MFHAKNGLYFERQADSSVKVVLKRTLLNQSTSPSAYFDGENWHPDIAFEVVLDPLTWASVIAAVSKRGQVTEVIEAALTIHEASLEGERCVG